jgi:uncharacterized damage-inducible protein DinB
MTDRPSAPVQGDERTMVRGMLDFHRATLALKCAGLTDTQLRHAASPPSTLSLLGLLRHLAEVERTWFRRVLTAEDVPLIWSDSGDFQAAYDARDATGAEAFAAWEAEVARAREIEAAAPSLDVTGWHARSSQEVSLRWVLLHMIHEYARHNGHADLIREAVDGATGV